ncbi:diaminopropionate ammonia-lyase [Clostridium sp. DL1XJH146]
MSEYMKIVHYDRSDKDEYSVKAFGVERAKKVNAFHKSFPDYSVTPLAELKELSNYLNVKNIYVKDESARFGLNAFKGLGGSYCIGKYIAGRLGMNIEDLSYEKINSPEIKKQLGDITFVTATDGNHGRGVAWTAAKLGYKSVVYMPKGSAVERLNNIKTLGAEACITELNYDDTVRYASNNAAKYGWVLVQDTSWDGYETIPAWIMEGYTSMGHEIAQQLNGEKLTHIFLQAGVGAMAGAITGFFADFYSKKERPIITIVEPNKADCIYRTAEARDDKLHIVSGNMDTIMAGLACGEPCTIGWNILKNYADNFVSVPDYVAAKGMRVLANPLKDDSKVISGESGAATLGFVAEVMLNPNLINMKETLNLDRNSKILCISTEGDTDKENYRKIVWDGLYTSF